MSDDLFELRNTKLPRHHRDAEDAMRWAADEIERLRRDAARWNALITSPRIRIMGSAGFDKEGHPAASMDDGYMHFGLEVWSRHSDSGANGFARSLLENYADAMIERSK